MKFIIYIIFSLVLFNISKADDSIPNRYINNYSFSKIGIFGGLNFINQKAEFSVLPGSKDCGMFDKSSGNGYFAGAFANYSIIDETLSLTGKVFYDYLPFNFEKLTNSYEVFNPNKNEYESLVLNNIANGSFKCLSFALGIESKPLDIPLLFNFDIIFSETTFGSNYSISQNIESPLIYSFNNNSKTRVIYNSSFNTQTAIYLNPGISYEYEFSDNLFLSPGISYSFPINSSVKDLEWKTNVLRIGLSLYTKLYSYPEIEKPVPIDTIIPPPPPPIAVDTIKIEVPVIAEEKPIIPEIKLITDNFNISETIVTQTYPILPYIFFDSLRSEVKNIYINKIDSNFKETSLPKSTLGIYYHIIDIIGSRLKVNSKSKIKIIGTTDGTEGETDEESIELAEERAKSVAELFNKRWGISQKRMNIKAEISPKLKTNTQYKEGFQENRRVEIYSDDNQILEPVIHKKFQEFKLKDNKIRITKEIKNQTVLFPDYKMKVKFGNNTIMEKEFTNLDEINEIILEDNQVIKDIESNPENLSIELRYKDIKSKEYVFESKIKPEYNKEQFELGRLNLIVFDFDKSELSRFNQGIIEEFINKAITGSSNVNIIGSTDRLGEKDYNLNLSTNRANSVHKFMIELRDDIDFKEIKGIGDSNLLYDNNLPEGRFYCRTVLIESKTPLEKK